MNTLLPNADFTIGEASKRLGVSIKTLRRWEKSGKINSFKTVGGHRRFNATELLNIKNGNTPNISETLVSAPGKNYPKSISAGISVVIIAVITSSIFYLANDKFNLPRFQDCLGKNDLTTCLSQLFDKNKEKEVEELKAKSGDNDLSELNISNLSKLEGDLEIYGDLTLYGIGLFLDTADFPGGANFGYNNNLLITDTGRIISNQNISASSLTIAGNTIINSNGKIPALNGLYFEDLNGENLTNIDAHHLGGKSAQSFLRSDEPDTAEAVITFTASPGSTDVNGGPLYINPAAASSDYTLLGIAVNGTQKLRVDAEGDMYFTGGLNSGAGGFLIDSTGNITRINSIAYSFPSSQGVSGSVLTNNGIGSLSWGTISSSGITEDSLDFAQFADAMTLDATTTIDMDTNSADINFDSGTLFIDNAGYVGIGNTSPDAPLDVSGDVYISDGLSLFETAVSDGVVEATSFCTGDGETNCVTDFSSLVSGSGLWSDSTTTTYLTTTTDDLVLGGNTPLSSAKLSIDGDTDQIQMVVQGAAGQTANLTEWQNSSGTVLSGTDKYGYLFSTGSLSNTNNFIGAETAGLGNIAHTTGNEGYYNVGLGYRSLRSITTGYANTAIGSQALINLTTGRENFAVGRDAGTTITTGYSNISFGASAGNWGTNGSLNVAIGNSAAISAGSVIRNVAVGAGAFGGVTSNDNTGIGYGVGSGLRGGGNNTMIGFVSGQGTSAYNATGNVFVGHQTGLSLQTNANYDTLIGYRSGYSLTTGASNIFLGNDSGYRQTTNSNLLIIDNQQRADVATEATNAILYGAMATTPGSQTLSLNALTTVSQDLYLSSGLSTFGTTVSDGTIEATGFCTGDGETNCVTDFSTIVSGSSIWTDGGTYIHPTNAEVLGNSTSAGSNKLAGLYLADSSPLVFGADNDITYNFSGTELAVSLGNNDINFDSNTLFIDGSTDRVGIGTTGPSNRLHVVSSATNIAGLMVTGGTSVALGTPNAYSGQLLLGDNAGAQGSISYENSANGYMFIDNTYNNDAGNIFFRTKTGSTPVNALTILGSGNVGIGDTSPEGKLDIEGAVVGQALMQLNETGDQDILTASASGTTRLRVANNGDVYVGTGTFDNASGSPDLYITGNLEVDGTIFGATSFTCTDCLDWDDLSDAMTLDGTTTIDMDTNSADLNFDSDTLFIDSSANRVGIGTTSPQVKLNVVGNGNGDNVFQIGTPAAGVVGAVKFFNSTFASYTDTYKVLQVNYNNADKGYVGYMDQGGWQSWGKGWLINTNNSNTDAINLASDELRVTGEAVDSAVKFYINSAGNVGIGDTTPEGKLDIEGAVVGQALMQLNEIGNQAIFVASKSGTTKFVIDNEGDVGIGVTSPGAKLDILSSIGGVHGINLDRSSASRQSSIQFSDVGAVRFGMGIAGTTGTNFQIANSDFSTNFMTIQTTGNVGIGTTDQFGSGAKVLAFGNATTNPTTTLTDAALLYASGGELYAYDASGNATPISPHDVDTNLWVFESTNTQSGKHLFVEMEKLTKDLDIILGGGYVFENGTQYYEGESLIDDLKYQITNYNNQTPNQNEFGTGQANFNELQQIKDLAESYKQSLVGLDASKGEIDKLTARIDALETLNLQGSELTESSEPSIASASASTSEVDQVDTSVKIDTLESLMVLGATTLSDTVVNGKLNIGTLSLDNLTGAINNIGILKIQDLELGSLDIMNGKFEFGKDGNLKIKEGLIVGNDKIRGSTTINPGVTKLVVEKEWESTPVSIVATPNFNTQVWITDKSEKGFTINLSSTPTGDVEESVDWWAVW